MSPESTFPAQDLERLEALLADDAMRAIALPPDAMQGCFCALAIGPEPVDAVYAVACALDGGPGSGDAPAAPELVALATRFFESTRDAVASGTFQALLYAQRRGRLDYRTWCRGFLEGVERSPGDWYEAADPDDVAELLEPLHVIADDRDDDGPGRRPAEWRRRLLASEARLPETIGRIRDYWAIVRTPPPTMRRDGAKVGRNDPCPCGSGRKYKHCHGQQGSSA